MVHATMYPYLHKNAAGCKHSIWCKRLCIKYSMCHNCDTCGHVVLCQHGGGDTKKQKKDVMNVAEEEVISFLVDEGDGQDYNYDMFNVSDSMAMDECVSYYGDHQEKPKFTIVHNSAGQACCAQLLVNSSQFFSMENGDVDCVQLFINSHQFFSIKK